MLLNLIKGVFSHKKIWFIYIKIYAIKKLYFDVNIKLVGGIKKTLKLILLYLALSKLYRFIINF